MCNSLRTNCNSVSPARKSVLPVGNHWNSVSLTHMHTVSCHSHLTWGLKALTTSDTEFCVSDTHFQWCPKSAILKKVDQVFPDFLHKLFRYFQVSCTLFSRYTRSMMCKDLPPQNWRSLFPLSTGFSISMSAGCTNCVTHFEKKWWVALNSAFCRASRTLSYSSTVQLGTQDAKQRHRTQNIDRMDFPTSFQHLCGTNCAVGNGSNKAIGHKGQSIL